MDQRLPDPAGTAPPDWRGLCEELADSIELLLEMRPVDAKPLNITEERYARARAALAQPEPEVVGPGLTDQELLAVASGLPLNPDDDDILSLQRATIATALARWGRPALASAEELGELLEELRDEGDARSSEPNTAFHRAADLLEQLIATRGSSTH